MTAIGILSYVSAQTRALTMNSNRLAAQYLAEAGAKTAIARIYDFFKTNNDRITTSNISDLTYPTPPATPTPISLPNGSYLMNYCPDSNIPTAVSQINIQSIGKVNGVVYTAKVVFALVNSTIYVPGPGVVDLFKSGTYSHLNPDKNPMGAKQEWTVNPASGSKPASAIPPKPQSGYYQVKFGDSLDDIFTINYIGSCDAFTYGNPSGYGIYYGLSPTCTPDNPDGYVFQYDPGANGPQGNGSFFVKRVKAHPSNPAQASDNEYNYAKNDYYAGTGHYETHTTGSGRNKKTETEWVWNITPTTCDIPFEPNNAENGTIWVPLTGSNSVQSKLGGSAKFKVNDPHIISIQITSMGRHLISCDGVKILDFIDNTAGKIKSFAGTSTGLRSWNAEVGFYNSVSSSAGQRLKSAVVWQK